MKAPRIALLTARSLSIAVGPCELVQALDLELRAGELLVVLGCNGTGKTLTLHTLAGLRPPARGELRLGTEPLETLPPRVRAQRVGLLAQDTEDAFPSTVLEAVLIGRHPHLRFLQWTGAADVELARSMLQRLGLAGFEERVTATLSGGELRRVAIAALLAQAPDVYLLDEPSNHLDPQHQLSVLGLCHELARAGAAVACTLHDPTLAARFADRVLLLYGDGRWEAGAATELLTAQRLSVLYRAPLIELQSSGRRVFAHA